MLEDTTGSRMARHCLRDRDGREVDFLALIDGRPVLPRFPTFRATGNIQAANPPFSLEDPLVPRR